MEFVDPRTNPQPPYRGPARPLAADWRELDGLIAACKQGRLYDVESWIAQDLPIQVGPDAPSPRRRVWSALDLAIEAAHIDLMRLLLCNGYRTELEPSSPLDPVLGRRRWDMLDLLLAWGANPHDADVGSVLDTYQTEIFERFHALGVDLAADGSMAYRLATATSNRPLYGYVRARHEQDPRIKRALAVGLGLALKERSDKAVSLCLWAGADPRQRVAAINEEEAEDEHGSTAFEQAVEADAPQYLKKLGFDPERDELAPLYARAREVSTLRALLAIAPPADWTPIVERFIWRLDVSLRFKLDMTSLWDMRQLFALGARLERLDAPLKKDLRRLLVQLPEPDAQRLFRLLSNPEHMDRAAFLELVAHEKLAARFWDWMPRHGVERRLFRELAETPGLPSAIRRRAKERISRAPQLLLYTTFRDEDGEHRLSREQLYELVWEQPMFTLCKRFGLSDNGLRKRCKAMQVPAPTEGYWQALKSGQRPRRTPLKPV